MNETERDLKPLPLVAVPNFSEGRNERVIEALEATLGCHARVLNRHFDAQHNRVVYTIAAEPEKLAEAMVAGAEHALDLIDLRRHQGLHPHIGALDVGPAVWQSDPSDTSARTSARAARPSWPAGWSRASSSPIWARPSRIPVPGPPW
jgi:glutamate formiminotransferase